MMSATARDITIITAGAGSGKTYRIVTNITEAILGGVDPARIIATTFTRKAATELSSRIRERLIEKGRVEDARRIESALIGTVNSVCGSLLSRFSYRVGLPSHGRVMDESETQTALAMAIAAATDGPVAAELNTIGQRLGHNEARYGGKPVGWRADVTKIIDLARANRVDVDGITTSLQQSVAELDAALPAMTTDRAILLSGLVTELRRAIRSPNTDDKTKKTADVWAHMRRLERQLGADPESIPWKLFSALAGLEPAKKSQEALASLTSMAAGYEGCTEYQTDLRRYMELCFQAARQAQAWYAAYKRERGAIDFTDQEAGLLQVLADPEVSDEVEASFELLVVDEFQDTSPIQLALFLRLMEAGLRLVWVGDPKQSIFGFRDADPELMLSTLRAFPDATKDTLTESYRSRPQLVSFTNDVFTRAFGVSLPDIEVRLNAHRDEVPEAAPAVQLWRYPYDRDRNRAEDYLADLAAGVVDAIGSKDFRIQTPDGDVRPARAGDIVVLCRSNANCQKVAGALVGSGVPVVMARMGLARTPEGVLFLACLRYLADSNDSLAVAEIRLLTEGHSDAATIVSERLTGDRAAWGRGNPVVVALDRIRPDVGSLSLSACLDRVIASCELHRRLSLFGIGPRATANLDKLRAMAAEYTEHAILTGRSATIGGFVLHMERLAADESDEQAQPSDKDAVHVLTYHRAKGLEWPVVVATDLDSAAREYVYCIEMDSGTADTGVDENESTNPLAGRWIRFWPDPGTGTDSELASTLAELPQSQARWDREVSEGQRLLYVGLTRARDYLILPVRLRARGEPYWKWLEAVYCAADDELSMPQSAGIADGVFGDCSVFVLDRPGIADGRSARPATVATLTQARGPRQYPGLNVTPSSVVHDDPELSGRLLSDSDVSSAPVQVMQYGEVIAVKGNVRPHALGDACHVVFGVAVGRGVAPDEHEVTRILDNHGVHGAVDPADLMRQAAAFVTWMHETWPSATADVESSGTMLRDGQVISARMDVVVDADDEHVVIDHKTLRGEFWPATVMVDYQEQLQLYEDLLRAVLPDGRRVRSMVNLVLQGVAVAR
jgi:ATP-dependent helicase/nuclease subunit A